MCGPIFHYGLGGYLEVPIKIKNIFVDLLFPYRGIDRPVHIAKVTRRCTNKEHLLVVIADAKIIKIPVSPSNVKREEIIATAPKGTSNMYSGS